ncbi:M24 family metallopeptidase [Truepera radiovictrix]|uniref:Xaa-Pro aminopeptidase family enzyme n=1 Tax=Truepera radiovictrix (strain DSM 17093 / CIP 108686 / LMG 22925 / RQ-24) TaxID=649638 RepID=D7CWP4_TRURR|nr:M24 family metallopeptidase [Truepera radiovictrix]ADI14443.1 Xaa-Pro aminopeptidase family enzyme [Truepera radiovictrix DSM 17093]WMT57000.1 M24 family metallopeptidase [Truepera radiovictrix]
MKLLPLARQAEVTNGWLRERLRAVLPEVMRRARVDLWLVVAREYNEDPVLPSLLPAPMMGARRRTMLVFHAPEGGAFEALAIANAGVGLDGFYTPMWDKTMLAEAAEDQWACLRRVVAERNPKRIGVNVSAEIAFADGLSKSEHDALMAALGPELAARCVSAEEVVVGWLSRRLEGEIEAADGINALAHGLIAEAFSPRVVHPGVTTAVEVAWWLRERARSLGLGCWFQPSVSIQRRGEHLGDLGSSPDAVIRRGDLLHCDFGLHYLGLATDTQQNAYVRRLGESGPPAGMVAALAKAKWQQELLAAEMVIGRSGNEVLRAARAAMARAGLEGRIYTHPIGYHGHGAGPMIGRYDNQEGLPGAGELRLQDATLFSFEMFVEHALPEWDGQRIKLATEQCVAFRGGEVHFLGGRQTAWHLI